MKSTAQAPQIELVAVEYPENEAAFCKHRNDVKNRIARRAYELYEHRGKTNGHDVDDWLEAEIETQTVVPAVMHETEHLYTIDAEISGFNANELKVYVEPLRIFITGRKRITADLVSKNEFKEIFKGIDLSHKIDVRTVIAELTKNNLTVSMRKLPVVTTEIKEQFSKSWRSRSGQLRKRADTAKRYADAARDQLHRATAKQKKARAMAFGSEADINMHSKQELANTNENTRRRAKEESRLQVS